MSMFCLKAHVRFIPGMLLTTDRLKNFLTSKLCACDDCWSDGSDFPLLSHLYLCAQWVPFQSVKMLPNNAAFCLHSQRALIDMFCARVKRHGTVPLSLMWLFVTDNVQCFLLESCCSPFKDDENPCNGLLIWFPKWLFPASDATKSVHTGTLICGARLLSTDKVDRIRRMERYITSTKVHVRAE